MIIFSTRKSFKDTIFFNKTYLIDEVDEQNNNISMGWNIGDVKTIIEDRTVCLLIHGYDNNYDQAIASYHVIQDNLVKNSFPYHRVFGFLWPGSQFAIDFKLSEWRANRAGAKLADIIDQLAQANVTIDIQTHSLGARVALQAAQRTNKIRKIILSAPAVRVDTDLLGPALTHCSGGILNCWSLGDPVLKKAFTFADAGFALGYRGLIGPPFPAKYAQADFSQTVHSHSGYRLEPSYYTTWKNFLTK